MRKYVQQGGDVNKQNKLGDTPLHEVRPESFLADDMLLCSDDIEGSPSLLTGCRQPTRRILFIVGWNFEK